MLNVGLPFNFIHASKGQVIIMNCCRYLELVHPIWRKTHFKMRYIYMATAFCWVFGVTVNASYMIPTGKVGLIHLHRSSLLLQPAINSLILSLL